MSTKDVVDILNTAADDQITFAPLADASDDAEMTEEQTYEFTQSLRRQTIRHARHQIAQINDPKIVSNLLKAASDMDKQVLGRRRLKNEETQTRNLASQHSLIAEILNSIPSSNNYRSPEVTNTQDHKLDDSLPPIEVVDGETDIGTSTMTHEAFVKLKEH